MRGEVTATGGCVRRAGFGRLEAGRVALRLLAPGRVLALAAVRGLADPFLAPFFGPFFMVLALAVVALAVPLPAFGLVAALEPLPALVAAAVARAGVLVRADVADFDRVVRDLLAVVRDDLVAGFDADLAVEPARRVLAELDRFVPPDAGLAVRADREDAVAAGLADCIDLAALVSALAAAVIDLVAVFIACIAVDIVLADDVALVAAAVILVAAEVTLVAAEETVLAAVAGVGDELAEERRVVRPAVPRADEPAVVRADERVAVRRVELPVLRAALRLVLRVVDLAPVARAVAFALGRPAERREALVLTDRALPAGLRRAVARVVVCTGTEFPPS